MPEEQQNKPVRFQFRVRWIYILLIIGIMYMLFSGGDANPHSLAFNITYNKNENNTQSNHEITGHAVKINKFEAGKKYIVTLRFNTASKVEINTVVVEDWSEGSTYEPPVFNW